MLLVFLFTYAVVIVATHKSAYEPFYTMKIKTKKELANLLGYTESTLSYILYKIPEEQKYRTFTIPKKNGGIREINAPNSYLLLLQKRLELLLSGEYEEMFKSYSKKHSLAHGFRKSHSIITNATKHKKKRFVFNIDLKDFFPSINFGRVRGYFIKNKAFELKPEIATVFAQIICHNNGLPQGSPTSPVMSNMIGHMLDVCLVRLAKKNKCTYSRYADDITFSTNTKDFPIAIANRNEEGTWIPGYILEAEIKRCGYTINQNKTSMQYKASRQTVTGLTVNEKVNINREYYKKVRSCCNNLFSKGEYYWAKKNETPGDKINYIIGSKKQLEGRLSYVYQVKKISLTQSNNKHNPIGIVKTYQNYLLFSFFIDNEKPIIVLEGKTDIIYLKCALNQLKSNYPELVNITDKRNDYRVSFFNFSKNVKEIFGISSGTSGLIDLINILRKKYGDFKFKKRMKPVIFVFDTDDGAKVIKQQIKKQFNIETIDYSKKYAIQENIFILFSTSIDNTEIEDLFSKEILSTIIDGKAFNRSSDFDNKTEYSKIVFAEKIIKANQNTIDFANFSILLNNIKDIVNKT